MKSSQLLSALNKQSHHQHSLQSGANVLPTSIRQNILDRIPQAAKQNQFGPFEIEPPAPGVPEWLRQMAEEQKASSTVTKSIADAVQKITKQREENVYLAFIADQAEYLGELSRRVAPQALYASKVEQVMQDRLGRVLGDLHAGRIIINQDRAIKSKEQVEKLVEMDTARLIKIKEGAIRSKLDLMQARLQEIEQLHQTPPKDEALASLQKKIEQNLDLSSYKLDSQKTQIAKDYVRFMAQQKRQLRKREQGRAQRRAQLQQERQSELKQAQEMRDLAKKQELLQKIEQKRKKREEQQKQFADRQSKIQELLSKYRAEMPIFMKKQKQFEEKFVKPERAYRQQKLKEIKQQKKSYSLNDIREHEKKYEEIRRKQLQRLQKQKQMQLKSILASNKEYYKGSAHKIVQQIDRENKEKSFSMFVVGKNKSERVAHYAKKIKQEHQPKMDESKRAQILKSLQEQEMKARNMVKRYKPVMNEDGDEVGVETFYEEKPTKDRYREGNRYMEMGKMKRKKNVSASVEVAPSSEQSLPEQTRVISKQNITKSRISNQSDIWALRSKQLAQLANNFSSHNQFEQMKVNFENLDRKAAQKQALMKHAEMGVQEHFAQKSALDQFYLESIRNKMKLLQ